ncbi:low-density lipoprotein receptor-related protein 11 isoform X1 [Triplophysa rosa]|uniref:Low-density lipoprotein receptor-related protein 11 n=1 Tax=Triplophysa rosa TaxID=992332 RepID=A0A9W7TPH4_TRIRA|nr:low-density lipoprotein receptor-related protein 11 isoform X1 [Triplophysa rosa]KAI7800093.1 putative low-density lipoprotein receptor-related protein 11 [Triplophysa rosa]
MFLSALICSVLLCVTSATRSSPTTDLTSKTSKGVEELLEEFRKQLQQDESDSREDDEDGDVCVSGFAVAEERIIRASASIEQGAAFLSAPPRVFSWRDCVHACCSHPRCTDAIIQEDLKQPDDGLRCYLFNCTYRGRNVCSFSFQPGFSTYSRANSTRPIEPVRSSAVTDTAARRPSHGSEELQGLDEPPRTEAGQDLVVQLPTDWAVLDGRDSTDDYGIAHYQWTLVKGDPSVRMKVTHPGLLKLGGLREGMYTFQITVTDTAGQKSSDNVSVSVLAPAPNAEVCTGHCSRYQFTCDDGCCIDIGYACDGKQHCPDRSDENFCQNFDSGHKSSPRLGPDLQTETAAQQPSTKIQTPDIPYKPEQHYATSNQDPCSLPPVVGPCKGVFPRWYYDTVTGQCLHFQYGGCKGNHNNFLQKSDCVNECIQKPSVTREQATATPSPGMKTYTSAVVTVKEEKHPSPLLVRQNSLPVSKVHHIIEGHPPPESGAILPLALGLIISILLLLMVICRLWLVRHRLKKALPLTTEESDYLINGMYL